MPTPAPDVSTDPVGAGLHAYRAAGERARELAALASGPLKTVERRTAAREAAAAKYAEADQAWRDALAAALEAGAAVQDVAAAAKVHRSRVWQLLRKPKTAEPKTAEQ